MLRPFTPRGGSGRKGNRMMAVSVSVGGQGCIYKGVLEETIGREQGLTFA